MPRAEHSALVREAQDWLVELCALRDRAIARRDFVQSDEIEAEIAEVTACLDGVLDATEAV